MVSEKSATSIDRSWPWWRLALTGLSALALALSAYLSWHHLAGGSVIGCGDGSPCDQVLSGRWSTIGGVLPVAGLAAGAYLAMLVAVFSIGPDTEGPVRRLAWRAMLVLVGSAAGSAVWFTILQKWVIGAFCPYCMAAHVTGLVLAAMVIWQAPRQSVGSATSKTAEGVTPTSGGRVIRRWPAVGLGMVGVALAGVMAASQVALVPPPVYRAGTVRENVPTFDPKAVPLVGSSEASYLVNLFFDYRCPHCQQLHAMLEEVMRWYEGKVAFVLRPAPLNTQCNPYIGRDRPEYRESCDLVKVSLAVWVADREAFAAFDEWMYSGEPGRLWYPRSLEAAKAKAAELVGQAKFDAASTNPWIARYMQTSIEVYGDTVDETGNSLPRLAYGGNWVTPEPNDAEDVVWILHYSLDLPRPDRKATQPSRGTK